MAILTARKGQADPPRALLRGMVPHCRAEPGNLRWDVWQDRSQADRYVLDKLYTEDAAVAAHRATTFSGTTSPAGRTERVDDLLRHRAEFTSFNLRPARRPC